MDAPSIHAYITKTFADISVIDAGASSYFFTDPEQKHPFATLVASDEHDRFSDLDRPGVCRLNVGVSKQTFGNLFGGEQKEDHDYKALDRLMPHPVYGKMYWLCVLNPGAETWERVKGLLAEAYETGMQKRKKTS